MVRGGASTVTPVTQRSPGSGGPGREMRACRRAERLHGSVSCFGSSTSQLCSLGQVASLLWASVSSPLK